MEPLFSVSKPKKSIKNEHDGFLLDVNKKKLSLDLRI
jgi:hypothetical protein